MAVLSPLMARTNLWWTTHRHRAHLVPAHRSNAEPCLHWTVGSTTTETGQLRTTSPVKIPGTRLPPPAAAHDVGLAPPRRRHPRTEWTGPGVRTSP